MATSPAGTGTVDVTVTTAGITSPTSPADHFTYATGTATTTAVSSSSNPAAHRQTVTFTATVTAQSGTFDNGGSVQFAVDGRNFGSPQDLDSAGVATIRDSALRAGIHSITATYSGDTGFFGSTGAVSQTVVGPISLSHSTIAVSPSQIPLGGTATVTLTALDANGNQEPDGGLKVVFKVRGSAGGAIGAVTDNKNGTYTAVFSAGTTAGKETITATVGGRAVTAKAVVTVVPGAASLWQSPVAVSSRAVAPGKIPVISDRVHDAALRSLTLDESPLTRKPRLLLEP